LILSNEIGDWVGGLRYWLRGGGAHLVGVVVLPQGRDPGHAHRLVGGFEERGGEAGAPLGRFLADDERSQANPGRRGGRRIFQRDEYIGRRSWSLMEKQLQGERR